VEIWEKGKLLYDGPETRVAQLLTPDRLVFGLIFMIRTLILVRRHTRGIKTDVTIAGTYSSCMAALLMRVFGKTRHVVSFQTDYLPIKGNPAVRLHRRIVAKLTDFVASRADEVWAISPRIPHLQKNPRNFVVPICLSENPTTTGSRLEVAYVGFPSPDHALEILFDVCKRHQIKLNIVGDSPYLQTIRQLAPTDTVFHGIINDAVRMNAILSRCFCGYAVYLKTGPDNYSYYGFPSKTFFYLASDVPVVITDTAHFTRNIKTYGVGHVVPPTPEAIEAAILNLRDRYSDYLTAIRKFRDEWNASAQKFNTERLQHLFKS
jgi:glycosyltransferase involved in cell wall biosynthesis